MYQEFNRPIQQLLSLMKEYYPSDYELVITSEGAVLRSTEKQMSFTNETQSVSPYFFDEDERPRTAPIDEARLERILKAVYKR